MLRVLQHKGASGSELEVQKLPDEAAHLHIILTKLLENVHALGVVEVLVKMEYRVQG